MTHIRMFVLVSIFAGCGRDGLLSVEPTMPDLGEPATDMAKSPPPDMARAKLIVKASSITPPESNYVMGSADELIFWFEIVNNADEDVGVEQIVASIWYDGAGAVALPRNIRLIDLNGKQLGAAAVGLSTIVNGQNTMLPQFGHAEFFPNPHLFIPSQNRAVIGMNTDFNTYEQGGFTSTGQMIVPAILQSLGDAGVTIKAVGVKSGQIIPATVVADPNWPVPGTYGNKATAYRTKLTTSWANDTPSGAVSPSASQVISKFVITNLANAGSYDSVVQSLNLSISTTIKPATDWRNMTIYKDSLNTVPLAVFRFAPGKTFTGTITIAKADFNNGNGVAIASGTSTTFWVTLDTNDAQATNSLSVRISQNSWSDGVSDHITAMGTDLPLVFKTFDY